eukprot:15108519-Alexandrium_andersonii.AAC.1
MASDKDRYGCPNRLIHTADIASAYVQSDADRQALLREFKDRERFPAEGQYRIWELNRRIPACRDILQDMECIRAGPEGRFFPEHFFWRYCDR